MRRIQTRHWVTSLALLALTGAGTVASAPVVDAVTGYHVVVGSAGLNAHSGPAVGAPIVGHLVNGQALDIACQTKGTLVGVGLPGTPTDVWDRLANGWFITDYYTSTPGLAGNYTPGIPQCGSTPAPPPPPKSIYNRAAAEIWAIRNFDQGNGSHLFYFGDDCTYFVSQALWAGGLPKTPDWTDRSNDKSKLAAKNTWNPGPTKDATAADYFKNYVVNAGIATINEISWTDKTAGSAQPGDIIGYDWNNKLYQPGADGFLDHVAIVTKVTQQGGVDVTQHSPSRLNRSWSWDPDHGKPIQVVIPRARAYLLHIIK